MGYAHRQIRWSQTKLKKCHIDIYVKTKNWSYTCSEALNPLQHLFQAFNSLLRSFTGSSSLYFQARTAWRLLMMLIFSELQWNRSFRPKANSAKSFLMLLDYRIKIIQSVKVKFNLNTFWTLFIWKTMTMCWEEKSTPLTVLKKLKDNWHCYLYVKWMYVFCKDNKYDIWRIKNTMQNY